MEGGQSAHKQAMNISLVMVDLQQNLNKEETFLPHQPEVGHGVAEALDLHGAELVVHGEVCEVHVARGLYCQPEQNGIDNENDCLDTGTFSKDFFSQGAVNEVFLGSFQQFFLLIPQ